MEKVRLSIFWWVWTLMAQNVAVTSREGRVSRNLSYGGFGGVPCVTSREGRVSRNETHEASTERESQSRPARDVWVEIWKSWTDL